MDNLTRFYGVYASREIYYFENELEGAPAQPTIPNQTPCCNRVFYEMVRSYRSCLNCLDLTCHHCRPRGQTSFEFFDDRIKLPLYLFCKSCVDQNIDPELLRIYFVSMLASQQVDPLDEENFPVLQILRFKEELDLNVYRSKKQPSEGFERFTLQEILGGNLLKIKFFV
jgi:hypothetical protein